MFKVVSWTLSSLETLQGSDLPGGDWLLEGEDSSLSHLVNVPLLRGKISLSSPSTRFVSGDQCSSGVQGLYPSGLFREAEPVGCREKGICYGKLAPRIMEAEESCCCLRAGGSGKLVVKCSLRGAQGGRSLMSPLTQSAGSPLPLPFVQFRLSVD